MKHKPEPFGTGSVTWWNDLQRRGRGIAYPNSRGEMTPLLDGVTGDVVLFSKADQYGASYGQRNEASRVMRAMEKFDELSIVR